VASNGGRVYVETYGCALNHADTWLMLSVLEEKGYRRVFSVDEADVIIINTCTVRLDTEERMRRRIKELYKLAEARNAKLVVAGCMATAQPYTVKRIAPRAVLVSTSNVHYVDKAVSKGVDLLREPTTPKTSYVPRVVTAYRREDSIAEIAIEDGCLGDCSFCITRLARRHVYSRPLKYVKRLVEEFVRMGVKEIRLTGQDVAVYGIDLEGKRLLPSLLEEIVELPGDFMVRVGMMSPDQAALIIDELLDAYRHPKVFKFFHLPVQSGDDRVLKIMKRNYSVDEYRSLVREVRRKIPGALIATDIIVGHPGEDEEAFENTIKLIEELRFERVHVAQYTPRPRTLAAGLPQIPSPVKKERSKKVMKVVERIGWEEHKRYVGSRTTVLVVAHGERGGLDAKLYNYMPVVLNAGESLPGRWECVEIVEATWYDLRGKVVGGCGPG